MFYGLDFGNMHVSKANRGGCATVDVTAGISCFPTKDPSNIYVTISSN